MPNTERTRVPYDISGPYSCIETTRMGIIGISPCATENEGITKSDGILNDEIGYAHGSCSHSI